MDTDTMPPVHHRRVMLQKVAREAHLSELKTWLAGYSAKGFTTALASEPGREGVYRGIATAAVPVAIRTADPVNQTENVPA